MANLNKEQRVYSWSELASRLLTLLAATTAIIVALASFYSRVSELKFPPFAARPTPLAASTPDLRPIENRLSKLESEISTLSNLPINTKIGIQIKDLKNSVAATNREVSELNETILESPVKALEIPLMRRDMENMKASNQTNLEALKEEISRLYGLGEWFIGLMVTMAIGILSLAITNFLSRPKKDTA